jgi:6-phosphogluconolactonase (cycloisomerase 2 family)
MEAQSLLQENETAIAVFTKGSKLQLHADNTGTTGDWVVGGDLDVDKVIIYHRRDSDTNEVYLADFDGVSAAGEGRYKIHFTNAKLMDSTDKSWSEFAATGQNPVRYIRGQG